MLRRMKPALVGLVLVLGCDGEVGLQGGPPQGLTLFSSDPSQGLAGMYAEGNDGVLFETVRQVEPNPAPQHDLFAADGTALNISVRYTDMEGRNLFVSIASHNIPSTWPAGAPVLDAAAKAQRPALFQLANRAAQALANEQIDQQMIPERTALVSTGRAMVFPSVKPPALPAAGDRTYASNYAQYYEVHSAPCCGIAEHSAVVFWNYGDDGQWYSGWQSNNHGRYALEMGAKCGSWTGWHGWVDVWALNGCDVKNGYAVCGLFGGDHNCHDDSKLEMNSINWNYQYYSWNVPGFCSGWGCDTNAPGCGTF
jgi:hypothetical protein